MNESTTYVNPNSPAVRLSMPAGGVAAGMSVNNPSGYALDILDGTRVLYSVPPLSVITLPVNMNGGSFYAVMEKGQRSLGVTGSDSVATVTLSSQRYAASNASLGSSNPKTNSVLYSTDAAGIVDAQLIIPAGYRRRVALTVATDIYGVWLPASVGGSLVSTFSPNASPEQIRPLAMGATGTVNLDLLPAADSYAFTFSGAGTALLTLESTVGAGAVQVYPHAVPGAPASTLSNQSVIG